MKQFSNFTFILYLSSILLGIVNVRWIRSLPVVYPVPEYHLQTSAPMWPVVPGGSRLSRAHPAHQPAAGRPWQAVYPPRESRAAAAAHGGPATREKRRKYQTTDRPGGGRTPINSRPSE